MVFDVFHHLMPTKVMRDLTWKRNWQFSFGDVVAPLTDSVNVTDYLKKMRKRDAVEGKSSNMEQ